MFIEVKNEDSMKALGRLIGALLVGGEIIELIGDVGAGKTTLTKGIAVGLDIKDNIQSPSFTINRVYKGHNNISLSHYDFYRLNDAGIMADELREVISDSKVVTIIEWGGAVSNVLPIDRLTIDIIATSENDRKVIFKSGGEVSSKLKDNIKL